MLDGTSIDLSEILDGSAVGDFKPVAYFDKFLDCIRIELRDCSMTEERINETITTLRDNYPGPGQDGRAGLMIKGVHHLFIRLGIPMSGIVLVTEILNSLLADLPEDHENVRAIQRITAEIELTINMGGPDDRFDLPSPVRSPGGALASAS